MTARPSTAIAALAVAAAAAACADAARTRESFDMSWKYVLGDQGFKPTSTTSAPLGDGFCGFDINLTGTQCYGLTSGSATTADECAAACCVDYQCLLWQFDASDPNAGYCWYGTDCSQNTSNAAWVSAARASAPSPPGPPQPSSAPCTDASKPCSQAFDDSAWRTVNTPHDFIVEGVADQNADRGHGYLPFNKSWYRKTFTVPSAAQGQLVWLDFDGVYKNSDMWLNGIYLGHFTSGYVSFRYYLHNATAPNSTTPVLNYGATTNVLAVFVDAESSQEGWFYEGGGITRHVWLNTADPLSITPWGAFFPSVPTGAISSGPLGAMGPQTAATALINAQVDIQNGRAAAADTTLVLTVMDASGATVATSSTKQTVSAGGWARVTPSITWSNVNLWNTESTYMYSVRADVVDNGAAGAVVDSVVVPIGVRDAIWTANTGFMLNGYKVPAKGFSQHQDFAGCGTAVPDRVNEFRVAGIRAIGGNFWRTAHNPTNPELLDFSDRHGMLMCGCPHAIAIPIRPPAHGAPLTNSHAKCNPPMQRRGGEPLHQPGRAAYPGPQGRRLPALQPTSRPAAARGRAGHGSSRQEPPLGRHLEPLQRGRLPDRRDDGREHRHAVQERHQLRRHDPPDHCERRMANRHE